MQSAAAASACKELIAKAKDDSVATVRPLSARLERLADTLSTPDAKVLAHLCRLQAWSTLSTTEPAQAAVALKDARATTAVTDSLKDAMVLSAAVWAIHTDAPKSGVDDALNAAAALDASQLERAARVQGLRALYVVPDLAKAAFEQHLPTPALQLANLAVTLTRERYGAGSTQVAKLNGRLARYAMKDEPALARQWGDRALELLAAAHANDMSAAPLRISVPAALLVRANALDNSAQRIYWLRRVLEESARAAAMPADNETREEVLEAWFDLIEYLGDINQLAEQRTTLSIALRYAGAPELGSWRAKLLVQQAALQDGSVAIVG